MIRDTSDSELAKQISGENFNDYEWFNQIILANNYFVFVTVLRSAFTGVLFEGFTKVTEIIKSAFVTYFIDADWFFGQ